MTRETLQFVHSTRPPDADVEVFDRLTREFLDAEFTFRVVGSSHYVSAPAYDFYELSSCERVAAAAPTFRLDADWEPRTLTYETDRLRCETRVERRPLAAFPRERSFDLVYWFGDDAVTTVDVADEAFETFHTYPEFDLALFTRTTFVSVDRPSPPAANSAD